MQQHALYIAAPSPAQLPFLDDATFSLLKVAVNHQLMNVNKEARLAIGPFKHEWPMRA